MAALACFAVGLFAGHRQQVLLGDYLEAFGGKARDRQRNPEAVAAGPDDVIGRIGVVGSGKIDAEDLLRSLGAEKVIVANSVADDLSIFAGHTFSFALLDVSLGSEKCLPVARYVKANSVHFVFVTGYGENLSMGEAS